MHRNKGHLKEGALDHLALFVRQKLHPMIGQKMTASGHMLGRAAVVSRPVAHHNYAIQTSLIGQVAELVGIEGGVVSGVINLESSGV
jgi:hypothetical protein